MGACLGKKNKIQSCRLWPVECTHRSVYYHGDEKRTLFHIKNVEYRLKQLTVHLAQLFGLVV